MMILIKPAPKKGLKYNQQVSSQPYFHSNILMGHLPAASTQMQGRHNFLVHTVATW